MKNCLKIVVLVGVFSSFLSWYFVVQKTTRWVKRPGSVDHRQKEKTLQRSKLGL